ncbi:hypothetical protein NPIL_618961 [Nephila pilipes]|uniref:Uncharacterized protein n=1 Tax=Nephila pilipes TaxID=299642 RepID=A0A8X6TI34_NEPPI|nr:hypothetical protein NPIL_618961 [Nephila pilipes]
MEQPRENTSKDIGGVEKASRIQTSNLRKTAASSIDEPRGAQRERSQSCTCGPNVLFEWRLNDLLSDRFLSFFKVNTLETKPDKCAPKEDQNVSF